MSKQAQSIFALEISSRLADTIFCASIHYSICTFTRLINA